MKQIGNRICLFGVFILICFNLFGCGSKQNEYEKQSNPFSKQETTNTNVPVENFVTNTVFDEANIIHEYTLYIVNDAKIVATTKVSKELNRTYDRNEIYKELIEELVDYIGYQVQIKNISVEKDKVYIDFAQDSDLFFMDRYNAALIKPISYTGYDSMVWGILDSITETIKKNLNEEVNVYFLKEGNELCLPELLVTAEFPLMQEYLGSEYYIRLYFSRAEGNAMEEIELGMTYNQVLLQLHGKGIDTTQTERFSRLGDHNGWEEFENVDEYLRNAWLHIELDSSRYRYSFDGENTVLMKIEVTSKGIPSSRGLSVGDSVKQLIELYGEEEATYAEEGCTIYEYHLEDCYFHAVLDEDEESIIRFGISSNSHSEEIRGQQIIDLIKNK